ncbi:hypothetical protein NGH44_02885 [Staphylococcus caprae]|nr:hypothetical protein [Staphylococcus caprae]MEB8094112.1 hypothetical protein [Staphylococcus caprae]
MTKLRLIKIALLIIILAEEIRNAKNNKHKYKLADGYNFGCKPATTSIKL